jgi:hypothetical protein
VTKIHVDGIIMGRRLFGEIEDDVGLQLIKSHTLNGGFVQMHYKII